MLLWLPVDLASSGHRTNRMKRLFARLFLLRFKLLLAGGASFFFCYGHVFIRWLLYPLLFGGIYYLGFLVARGETAIHRDRLVNDLDVF